MITTISLNPALDKTFVLNNFQVNEINKAETIALNAGGKGINVSKICKFSGIDTMVIGIAAGDAGRKLVELLDFMDITNHFVWVAGETRTNIKVVDVATGTCTEINEPGPFIHTIDIEDVMTRIENVLEQTEMIVFAGTVQKEVKPTIYKEFIRFVKKCAPEKKVILDTSGELLKEGVKAKPFLIKPNLPEFCELINKTVTTFDEVIFEAWTLVKSGIEYVCVSMGAEGLILVCKDKAYVAKPPKIEAYSTVGCGDAVLGSLLCGISRTEPMEEVVKYACAVGTASALVRGTDVPERKEIERIHKNVEINVYNL